MAKAIEIDEEEYNRLQRTAATLGKIASNPKAKALVEQAHKLVDPEAKTPTLDQQQPLLEAVETVNKTIADFTKAQQERDAKADSDRKLNELKAQQDASWRELRADRTWTDDGLKKVQEYMETKGLLDPKDAAALFLRDNPPPPPATPGGTGGWDFISGTAASGDDDMKKLIESKGENNQLLDKMSREALMEIRGQGPRR